MSWGNKLLITFIVFGSGMIYLVYCCMNTEFELVEKDYYKNELAYQQVIDASNRSGALNTVAKFTHSASGLQLQMPEEMKGIALEGEVWFYCAYDSRLDRKIKLNLDHRAFQQFAPNALEAGTYLAKLTWKDGGKQYYYETPLSIR